MSRLARYDGRGARGWGQACRIGVSIRLTGDLRGAAVMHMVAIMHVVNSEEARRILTSTKTSFRPRGTLRARGNTDKQQDC